MSFVGVDLHQKVISICVVSEDRQVVCRQPLACVWEGKIREWFTQWAPFQVVVEATASYEWFVRLVEPLAERVVLARAKKLPVIAESTRKSDKLDAQVLAELLAIQKQLRAFAKQAPAAEREARAVLETIPTVGPVTIDVLRSELGDVRRFRCQKPAVSAAGLAPARRESLPRPRAQGMCGRWQPSPSVGTRSSRARSTDADGQRNVQNSASRSLHHPA